jgi:hypothetical protein
MTRASDDAAARMIPASDDAERSDEEEPGD